MLFSKTIFGNCSVILATGFVHILPDAMAALTSPCLPNSWNVYGSYSGLFAMLGALGMQLIEYLAHQRERSTCLKHVHKTTDHNGKEPTKIEHTHNENVVCENKEETHSHTEEPGNKDIVAIETVHIEPPSVSIDLCGGSGHSHGILLQDNGEHNRIGTYLLELGIAVHSVLIGLTLGTATKSFIALFIALCFHQFFEAMALGAQIANLKSTSTRSAIFLILFFSCTTPVGVAIGIGVHAGTYNPQSVSSLLVTGILESFAAGILIYVALVDLITAEMGANAHGFYSLRTRLKWLYFIALYLGVALMAIVARWA